METYAGSGSIGDHDPTQNDFRIGGRQHTASSVFKGRIDEVDVYGRALLTSEVQAIFNASTAGKGQAPSVVGFDTTIQPDPASIEPCQVYDAAGSIEQGVGEACADFGAAGTPYIASKATDTTVDLTVPDQVAVSRDSMTQFGRRLSFPASGHACQLAAPWTSPSG